MASTLVNEEPVAPEVVESESVKRWSRVRAYGIRFGTCQLLAPVGLFCELVADARIAPMPNSPAHFCGLMSVRGKLVPVYQLHSLLQLELPARNYALVMGSKDRQAALLIPEKPQTLTFDALTAEPLTEQVLPDVFQGCVKKSFSESGKPGHAWWLLDHQALFDTLARMH